MLNVKTFLIILIAIILTGCGNGYFFKTKAIYQVDASNLSNGLTTGMISTLNFSNTIYFQGNTINFMWLKSKEDKMTNPSSFTTSLMHYLDKIGGLESNK